MVKKYNDAIAVKVPAETAQMSPKQIVLLMRSLGVGKENYAPPQQARAWTTSEFLEACTRNDVMRRAEKHPPERTTVDGWFSANGPLPDDRRDSWHYFFHVFFSYERQAFGTLDWKAAYFEAVNREKVRAVLTKAQSGPAIVPIKVSKDTTFIDILPFLKGRS